jgi:5-(carboxyamino)imidazole ribonucleotide synthase
MVNFPVQHNLHRDGILAVTQVIDGLVAPSLAAELVTAALAIAEGVNYVGVLCVEFFVLQDGHWVVNEMAPRPHNSGHYTMDACDQSQFDLQVRTLAGLPLVAPRQHSPAIMLNLLGGLWFTHGKEASPPWDQVLALPGAHLHLYGKLSARKGRKMGHLNFIAATATEVRANALQAAALLGIEAF